MNYLLSVDQGTSSSRAMIYTTQGERITSSQQAIHSSYPQPGWVEQDPEELWQKTLLAIREVVSAVPIQSIIACGISNQRETVVIWDKVSGECLSPAIGWQDRRTVDYCRSLSSYSNMVQEKTGLRLDPYFSASKLNWLLNHNPRARQLANQGLLAFGTIDSFLIWRLTKGTHLTDCTNASRTLLFNIKAEQWDSDLLDLFSIPTSVLPKVLASDGDFGKINSEIVGYEIPITGVAGDQQAALIGQGCVVEGDLKATFGTGGFLLLNTGQRVVRSNHRLLSTIAYKVNDTVHYGLEGSIYQAGTTIQWLQQSMHLFTRPEETEDLAKSLTSNEGVYLVSSFTGLGAPHWLESTGASIVGLSRHSNKAHFARAALEGVCYQVRDLLCCMLEDSQLNLSLMRVDGGMVANHWFLQFLADQCQLKIEKPTNIETTSRGAAMLAAIGLKVFDSLMAVKTHWVLDKQFTPSLDLKSIERDYQGWQKALQTLNISVAPKTQSISMD